MHAQKRYAKWLAAFFFFSYESRLIVTAASEYVRKYEYIRRNIPLKAEATLSLFIAATLQNNFESANSAKAKLQQLCLIGGL